MRAERPSIAPVDSDQLPVERVRGLELGVNAGGKSREIRVHGANDNAVVIRVEAVKMDKVLAVVGDHSAFVCSCLAEHFVIGNGVVGFACVK